MNKRRRYLAKRRRRTAHLIDWFRCEHGNYMTHRLLGVDEIAPWPYRGTVGIDWGTGPDATIVTLTRGHEVQAHASSIEGLIHAVQNGTIYTSDDADKQHLLSRLEARLAQQEEQRGDDEYFRSGTRYPGQ